MASSNALSLASLPGPPPTPTSLMGLPKPWLLQLATCKGLDKQRATLLALFRTCAFFRDAVLRHRTAAIAFNVPIAEDDFPAAVERLCAVARRSSSVQLRFEGQEDGGGHPEQPWTETEPHITHLLVCAMAQLEGEQPLACVKEIVLDVSGHTRADTLLRPCSHEAPVLLTPVLSFRRLQALEQTSLVPVWVKVLCPNATKLDLGWDTLAPHPLPQPRPHPHLQHLRWDRRWGICADSPLAAHVREQLAALPSLTSLALHDLSWAGAEGEDGEQQAGRLASSTMTRLELSAHFNQEGSYDALLRLPTQFPNLRELDASYMTVEDDGLEALLRLPHLERLRVWGFSLQRSHAHRACSWVLVTVCELDVGSFARLPLDGIPVCSDWWLVRPSTDAAAVARVAQAVRRWGGPGAGGNEWRISGSDVAALATTLGPLLVALPAQQQRRVIIPFLRDVTPQQVQHLGQHLPPSITTLRLDSCTLTLDAWAALLPSLPATVEELRLVFTFQPLMEQQVLALCQAAVRPIRVVVSPSRHEPRLSEQDLERMRASLVGPGLVTLVGG